MTLTAISKYAESNPKVYFLRAKAFLVLKNYRCALKDFYTVKRLSKGKEAELDDFISEIKK